MLLEPGGIAVLSGLLNRQARRVQFRYRDQRLILVRRYRIGDWTTLVLRRGGVTGLAQEARAFGAST